MSGVLDRIALGATKREWIIATSIVNVLSVVLTTVLVALVKNADTTAVKISFSLVAVALIVGIATLNASATTIREAQFPKHSAAVLEMIRSVNKALGDENEIRSRLGVTATDAEWQESYLRRVKLYLTFFQHVLADQWSQRRFGENTSVEVVLMKRAGDGKLTVACWATKRPLSLQQRASNRTFYENTEAAKLYRNYVDLGKRAPILLIPDISKYPDYDHFGRDATYRTNSTALFPIYDLNSEFYGFVAVTARNRINMFAEVDRDFWNEAWSVWEPHFVRTIGDYQMRGSLIDEAAIGIRTEQE
ncbi:hypothetical protein FEK33_02235 [Nocardia asteroides NBRC 15531]|uniref:hypothetical protein n=1 Tax=Nocardia asteroides TaxID=1824 RepID=UPI001109F1ED|nr:hypothetical protein [Nocardia asteroides]TLF69164.1 hypothetical protein FEK33_02235 [Nocardia asteroides NBRC 15531]